MLIAASKIWSSPRINFSLICALTFNCWRCVWFTKLNVTTQAFCRCLNPSVICRFNLIKYMRLWIENRVRKYYVTRFLGKAPFIEGFFDFREATIIKLINEFTYLQILSTTKWFGIENDQIFTSLTTGYFSPTRWMLFILVSIYPTRFSVSIS